MRPILLAPFLAALVPGAAFAQPALLSATPAADTTVAKPTRLALTFSERLAPAGSTVELVMTSMPGMANHAPMPIKGFKTAVEGDGRTLAVVLPRALPAGTYTLTWHTSGPDRHAAEGRYGFTVR